MSLRRSAVSKLLALWFVVLIVLPFTAPFRAWEIGAPIKPPSSDAFSSDKLPKDAATAVLVARVVPVCINLDLHLKNLNARQESHQVLRTVLRL